MNIYVTNHQSKGFYKIFNETARSIVHLFSWQRVKEGSWLVWERKLFTLIQISLHRVNIPINCHPKTAWRPTSWINFSGACKSLSELEIAPQNKFSFEIVKLFHLVVARSHRSRRKTPPQCPMGNVLFKRRENLVIRLEDYKLWEVYQTCKKKYNNNLCHKKPNHCLVGGLGLWIDNYQSLKK